jgi:hypothetical protein
VSVIVVEEERLSSCGGMGCWRDSGRIRHSLTRWRYPTGEINAVCSTDLHIKYQEGYLLMEGGRCSMKP